jgi:PKD repeat protein
LSATQLNASGGDIPGVFTYAPATGTVLGVGTQILNATFTPTDYLNYSGNSINVTLNVTQATPTITWSTPANITYGTGLSTTQLSATSPQSGSFAYSPTTGTIFGVGTHTLNTTFTPSGASAVNYTTNTASVNLIVNQATPSITWSNPAAITYGTTLNSTQLSATCIAAGTFTYTPASGYIMHAGAGQTLHVDFAPTDAVNYTVASKDVAITVNKGTTSFTANVSTVTIPAGVQFTDTSTGAPTHWSWDFGDGTTDTVQNPIHYFTTAGHHSVTLNFSDFANYTYESGPTDIFVLNAIPVANITMNGKQGAINTTAPLIAYFNDTSNGVNITQWSWDFNDTMGGLQYATTQNATHVFPLAGNYTVTLAVTNDGGINTTEMPITVVGGGGTGGPQKPIAGFSANASIGYIPLTVQFTNVSAFTPTSWRWDFGDNTNSTLENPIHTYPDRGVYNVTFTATNDYGSDTAQCINFIHTYYAPPVTNFITNVTNGDIPLNVQFTDTSTGIISAYNWSFGDGTYSTEQNPIHVYTQIGLYNVSLNASNIDNNYTVTRVNYIVVGVPIPAPVADFNANITSGAAPTTVQFVDNSTGPVSNYTWDFGDGIGSYTQNPVHVYANNGNYTVSLNVSNTKGFNVSTKYNYIVVAESIPVPVSDFHAVTTSGGVPFSTQFIDDSTGIVQSRVWDFGDGNTATSQNPTHTYTQVGVYTVSLNVSNSNGFNVSVKANYINATSQSPAPTAAFHAVTATGIPPLDVQFIDDSTGVVDNRDWDFGDGSTAHSQNPIHTYTQAGTYTVTLNASNFNGFTTSTRTNYIGVSAVEPAPVSAFHANMTGGLVPLTVQFVDDSDGNVSGRVWNFGDGNGSSALNPIHTYSTVGVYTVSLNVSNAGGSNESMKVGYINATDIAIPHPPLASFRENVTGGIAPVTVQFKDTSSNTPTYWLWNFGDGVGTNEQNPTHTYTVPGTYNVTLEIGNVDGNDTISELVNVLKPISIPVANFTSDVSVGGLPLTVHFIDLSSNDTANWLWDFGDNNTAIIESPTHVYQQAGNYTVNLTVNNSAGSNTMTKIDYIVVGNQVRANFTTNNTNGTVPLFVQFTDVSTGSPQNFSWNFGDNATSTEQNPMHEYNVSGNYSVSETVGLGNANDTMTKTDYITAQLPSAAPPIAQFYVSETNISIPDGVDTNTSVKFTDTSIGVGINAWVWVFGDGNTSNEQNPTHIYQKPGTYNVVLTATSPYGTSVSAPTTLNIIQGAPNVTMMVNVSEGYVPLTVAFIDSTTNVSGQTYWDFGDGSTSNESNPIHTYIDDGIYGATLIVNRNGQNYSITQMINAHYVTVATVKINATQQDQMLDVNSTAGKSLRLEQTSKQSAMYGAVHAVEKGTSGGYTLLVVAILILGALSFWFLF